MKYGITRLGVGCGQFIELTPEEYEAAKTAKTSLLAALGVEDKLDILLENYAEYELELHQITTRQYLFPALALDWSGFQQNMQTVNRRLANLLSACRLYLDQVRHDICEVYGKLSKQHCELRDSISNEYDSNLGYRVMDALRNHAQHRTLPVQYLKYNQSLDKRQDIVLVKHICIPGLSVTRLEEQGGFKASVLEELKDGEDSFDIKPFVRDYVSSIRRVHVALRKRMAGDVSGWDDEMQRVQDRFRHSFGDQLLALAVVSKDDRGTITESCQVFEDFIKRRRALEKKNSSEWNLRKHYSSSEVLSDA